MLASLLGLWMMGQAHAGDLTLFEGNWAVDLTRSDAAGERLMAMGRAAPAQQGGQPGGQGQGVGQGQGQGPGQGQGMPQAANGSRFSPDNGQSDAEDQMSRGWSNLQYLVEASGEVLIVEQADNTLGFRLPGDDQISVDLDGGWTKVKGDRNYKVRASLYEKHLMIQRKGNGNLVSETWLPPKREDERVVVVAVKSSLLGTEVEFRRVYRRLGKAEGKAPSSLAPPKRP